MQKLEKDSGPWYREPWPWILMAGPFLAIVGCIITIVLAFYDNPDQQVNLGARRHGLMVITESANPAASNTRPAARNAVTDFSGATSASTTAKGN